MSGKQTLTEAKNPVFTVHPSRIYVSPEFRTRYGAPNLEDVTAMQIAIKQDGQKTPVYVLKYAGSEDYDFTLEDGEHRLLACVGLDREIECRMSESGNDAERLISSYRANNDRKELTPLDRMFVARNLRNMVNPASEKGKKFAAKDIADAMKLDPSEITRLKSIEKLPDEILQHLKAGTINMATAVVLTDVKDGSAALKMAADGYTAKQVKAWMAKNDPETIERIKTEAAVKAGEKAEAKNKSEGPTGDGTEAPKGAKLSEVRSACAELVNAAGDQPETAVPLGEVCALIVEYIDGTKSDVGISEVFDDLIAKWKGKFSKVKGKKS